jgi:RNA polymerase sigma-70 factor (ECF subfamily)
MSILYQLIAPPADEAASPLNRRAVRSDLKRDVEYKPMSLEPDRAIDGYLVVLAQGGSRDAMDRLARRWTTRLVRYVSRTTGNSQTARDIVQETWLAAIRALPRLADSSQFPAWIYAIAHRKAVDSIRTTQRSRKLIEHSRRELEIADVPSESEAENQRTDLSAAITRLSEDQRAVVYLFYGEDLGVQEIATVLAVPVGTVKSRLFHARTTLKHHLGE